MKYTWLVIIIVNVLLSLPQISEAQAPDLGITAGFALFTAAGAINNRGDTFITGNGGTNSNPVTGFPPGTVVGVMLTGWYILPPRR